MTNQYINNTYQNFPVRENCEILRYPPEDYRNPKINSIQALDFTNLEQRKQIISILLNIQNYLINLDK